MKNASFSAYRPEAYAESDKRSAQSAPAGQGRQNWNDSGRGGSAQRSQAPTNDMYPRQAPERPAPQRDYRDPYNGGYGNTQPDPYSVSHKGVQQQDYVSDWQQPDYRDNGQYPNSYYDTSPQLSEAQAVHNRFFAGGNEPDHGGGRYPNSGYAGPDMPPPPPLHDDGYGNQASLRGGYGADQDYYDAYDQQPAPQSVRPQLPALTRVDNHDADFYDEDDQYDAGDFPEERRGGSKRLIAAVLIGAVITGGGLAFLYRASGHGDSGAPKMVEADSRPVKGAPEESGSSKFQAGNKSIQDRLGGDPSEAASAGEVSPEVTGPAETQETASVTGGTLEERIQSALRNAKKAGPGDETSASGDAPRTVQTVKVRPDGTFEAPQAQIVMPPQTATASAIGEAPQGVVVTSMGSNSRSVTAPATKVSQPERVASAPMISQPEPAEEAPAPAEAPAPRPTAAQKAASVAMVSTPTVQTGSTGGVFVQIAARQEQDQALAAFATLQQKYAAVLGNHTPSVRKVDLADKGTWYRLWVGPMASKAEADKLCGDLMTAGLKNCLVRSE